MIEKIEVRNWQSLESVDLELGRLTVIVGPSSSGKTALIRALRAVASNVRGAGHIRRGAKTAAITVRTGEHTVTLERTETQGRYRIVDAAGREETFTKLGGAVPEQVTAALRIDPVPAGGSSVNFAGQFDKPYLLDESGAAVARILGELTNVSTIFEAVREANRRRNALAATLRTRQVDLEQVRRRCDGFTDLPARITVLKSAEVTARRASDLAEQINRLRAAVIRLQDAELAEARCRELPTLPDGAATYQAHDRLTTFRQVIARLTIADRHVAAAEADVRAAIEQEKALTAELRQVLLEAGSCPTCGQEVTASAAICPA